MHFDAHLVGGHIALEHFRETRGVHGAQHHAAGTPIQQVRAQRAIIQIQNGVDGQRHAEHLADALQERGNNFDLGGINDQKIQNVAALIELREELFRVAHAVELHAVFREDGVQFRIFREGENQSPRSGAVLVKNCHLGAAFFWPAWSSSISFAISSA